MVVRDFTKTGEDKCKRFEQSLVSVEFTHH